MFIETIWNPNVEKYQLSYFPEIPPDGYFENLHFCKFAVLPVRAEKIEVHGKTPTTKFLNDVSELIVDFLPPKIFEDPKNNFWF